MEGNHSNMPKNERPRKVEFHSNLQILLLILCLAVFCFSLIHLISYFTDILAAQNDTEVITEAYHVLESTESENRTELPTSETETSEKSSVSVIPAQVSNAVSDDYNSEIPAEAPSNSLWPSVYEENRSLRISNTFYELKKKNKDIVAFVEIDGILEEPVVQRDNTYYLTHTATGKKSVAGAIFLDESCDLKKVPIQCVLYGHNMKEGSMFGPLVRYKTKDHRFYQEHPYITFNTQYEDGEYVIFAVCEADIRYGRKTYLPFWEHGGFTEQSFNQYIDSIRKMSEITCKVDVQPGDRLLILCTCINEDDNKRLLVIGRKIRPQEDRFQLNLAIMSSADR